MERYFNSDDIIGKTIERCSGDFAGEKGDWFQLDFTDGTNLCLSVVPNKYMMFFEYEGGADDGE